MNLYIAIYMIANLSIFKLLNCRWNHNADFTPRTYLDSQDLPVILTVVEKGKMGITYPRSLRFYDLRTRFKLIEFEGKNYSKLIP